MALGTEAAGEGRGAGVAGVLESRSVTLKRTPETVPGRDSGITLMALNHNMQLCIHIIVGLLYTFNVLF